MQRVLASLPLPLHGRAATQEIEQRAATQLPPQALMQRAGLALARLALALAPHARSVWIVCGPGNNGGDGAEAALHLAAWGKRVVLTRMGDALSAPTDARVAWQRVAAAGLTPLAAGEDAPLLDRFDLCIDALLGVGAARTGEGVMAHCIGQLNASAAPVLAVDLPSGLNADSGACAFAGSVPSGSLPLLVQADWTLSLLTLKPGLFTGLGRDAAGEVWFDDLEVNARGTSADATLNGRPASMRRPHASHKGSYGDLVVVGGAPGMLGAAILAATAALHAGAGRVYLSALQPVDAGALLTRPELMQRPFDSIDLARSSVVCGCGGGDAVSGPLPRILSSARALVLDADALNAIAADGSLQTLLMQRSRRGDARIATVLTPHPLEAARLLASTAAAVQVDRLRAAQELAQRFQCAVVLKGSGSIITAPAQRAVVNATGNARLATAGTGDVLAGMIGAALSCGLGAFAAACAAVYSHGYLADRWPQNLPLTAGALANAVAGYSAAH